MGFLDDLLKKKPEEMTADDFQALASGIEAEQSQLNAQSDDLIAQLSALSPEEVAWAEWFSQIPENHKKIVEMCSEKGIRVTPDNFVQVLAALTE